jgi:hypothetical protein
MAVGLLRRDAGRSEVRGVDVQADPMRARQLMGVLPDGLAMPERLTGRELLTLIGEMRGLDPDVITQRTRDLLEVMGLAGAERTLIVDYSAGMRKKIGLATALLHAPRLLLLDEPFEAVDPVSAATLRAILTGFRARPTPCANSGQCGVSSATTRRRPRPWRRHWPFPVSSATGKARPEHCGTLAACGCGSPIIRVAAQDLEEAPGIFRDLGDRQGEANTLVDIGNLRAETGNYPGSTHALEEALRSVSAGQMLPGLGLAVIRARRRWTFS